MKIQCIEDDAGLLRLRDEWNSLWRSSANPSYFLSYDWIRCCWEELRSANALRIFVVRCGTKPVMIAPWMISRGFQNRLPVKRLTFIDHPESQIADMICVKEPEAQEGFSSLIAHLRHERSDEWQLLALNKIPEDSPVVQWLQGVEETPSGSRPAQFRYPVLIVPLNGSWEDYLRSKSSRFRKTLRNIVNRIERMGDIAIHCYDGAELPSIALPKLFSIADASWKLASGVAVTSSQGRRRFFEELSRNSETAEHMRVWLLEVNGNAIASETQLIDRGTVYALRSDYDENFADGSPGVYLQSEILKKLFEDGYQEYNFGVGLNPYKSRWAEQTTGFVNYRIYNATLYSRLLRLIDRRMERRQQLSPLGMVSSLWSGKGT